MERRKYISVAVITEKDREWQNKEIKRLINTGLYKIILVSSYSVLLERI